MKPNVNQTSSNTGLTSLMSRMCSKAITILDDRFDYVEDRFVTLGLLGGRVVVIVHTETSDVIRIISARKATKNEEISYFKEISD